MCRRCVLFSSFFIFFAFMFAGFAQVVNFIGSGQSTLMSDKVNWDVYPMEGSPAYINRAGGNATSKESPAVINTLFKVCLGNVVIRSLGPLPEYLRVDPGAVLESKANIFVGNRNKRGQDGILIVERQASVIAGVGGLFVGSDREGFAQGEVILKPGAGLVQVGYVNIGATGAIDFQFGPDGVPFITTVRSHPGQVNLIDGAVSLDLSRLEIDGNYPLLVVAGKSELTISGKLIETLLEPNGGMFTCKGDYSGDHLVVRGTKGRDWSLGLSDNGRSLIFRVGKGETGADAALTTGADDRNSSAGRVSTLPENGFKALPPAVVKSSVSTLAPIRPGFPGKQFFWNKNASRFIYAPAFDLGADNHPLRQYYVYTVRGADKAQYSFKGTDPYLSLSEIWEKMPVGWYTISLSSTLKDGSESKIVGERRFFKAQAFRGPYGNLDVDYRASALRALEFQLKQPHYQQWKDGERGDFHYLCYPSKTLGGAMRGMAALARLSEDAQTRQDALKVARFAAEQLLQLRVKSGPYAGMPLTYDDKHPTALKSSWWTERAKGRLMLSEPMDSVNSFLDLYEVTEDEVYLNEAIGMFEIYQRTQSADGSWPLRVFHATGLEDGDQILIPTRVILTADRLITSFGQKQFVSVRDRAARWIRKNSASSFLWDGQFEDIPKSAPYQNLSHYHATDFARYLFSQSDMSEQDATLARDLIRFAEDQFVIWEHPNMRWNNAVTPAVLEQYWCYRPINASAAHMIEALLDGYKATKDLRFLEMARSLGNTQVAVADTETGQYRTFWYWDGTNRNNNWDNCAVDTALSLFRLADILQSKKND